MGLFAERERLMDPQYIIKNPDDLPTPALVVYGELVQHNIRKIGELLGGYRKLRPHFKTHKSSAILRLQMAAGIDKIKCATPKEAEVAAGAGIKDLVVAYPLIGPAARRVAELKARRPDVDIAVLADNTEAVDGLCRAAVDADVELGAFVDLNSGMDRTGAPGPEEALEVARRVADSPGLRFDGVHFYDGHIHDQDEEARRQKADASVERGLAAKALIERHGLPVKKLVTSGSPTFEITARRPEIDEVSPGTWVLWDRNYSEGLLPNRFRCAALVVARVISRPTSRTVTVDAGSKSISTDVIPVPDREAIPREEMASTLLNGHAQCLNWPGARFLTRNEEHLVIQLPEGAEQPRIGTLVYLVPRHVCSTVNLWDEMRVVDGEGRTCDTWPVDARGH